MFRFETVPYEPDWWNVTLHQFCDREVHQSPAWLAFLAETQKGKIVTAALRDAVLALRRNPAKARQMGENGRKYVEKHFRREVRARELSSALKSLLDGSGRPSTVPYVHPESSPTGESF